MKNRPRGRCHQSAIRGGLKDVVTGKFLVQCVDASKRPERQSLRNEARRHAHVKAAVIPDGGAQTGAAFFGGIQFYFLAP